MLLDLGLVANLLITSNHVPIHTYQLSSMVKQPQNPLNSKLLWSPFPWLPSDELFPLTCNRVSTGSCGAACTSIPVIQTVTSWHPCNHLPPTFTLCLLSHPKFASSESVLLWNLYLSRSGFLCTTYTQGFRGKALASLWELLYCQEQLTDTALICNSFRGMTDPKKTESSPCLFLLLTSNFQMVVCLYKKCILYILKEKQIDIIKVNYQRDILHLKFTPKFEHGPHQFE